MAPSAPNCPVVRFGAFEIHLKAGELRKNGLKIKLQAQPFQVLALLIEQRGAAVTHEELRQKLWPADTFVDFEHSVGTAIKKIRQALGDSATNPRFVETLPKLGYRFIAPVEAEVTERLDRGLGKEWASGEAQTGTEPVLTMPRARESETKGASAVPARERLAWLITAFCCAGMVALALFAFRQTPSKPSQAPLRKFVFTPPVALLERGNQYFTAAQNTIAVSPDGKHIVFVALDERRLWIHDFDLGTSRPLEGTEGADVPFWSPDGDFIGYSTGSQIRTIPARGGVSIRVYQGPQTRTHSSSDPGSYGAAWSPDGNSIVFSQEGKLYEIPARGGTARLLVSPEEPGQSSGESSKGPTGFLRWPHFLPAEAGARILVYTFGSTSERTMMVHDLESGRREVLGPGELPFYSPSGHLLYQAGPMTYNLWALPFSLDTLQATGPAFPIVKNGRLPMVASDQTLVYLDAGVKSETLVWLDRHGTRLGVVAQPTAAILFPRLSPDGGFAVVSAVEAGNRDLFVYDLRRNTKTPFTRSPSDDLFATWTHSGKEITFSSSRWGNRDIFRMSADGVGEAKSLMGTALDEGDHEWSSDGRFLVYMIVSPDTGHDIWYAKRKADGSLEDPVSFLQTPFSERIGALSPNSRFLAFSSDESGHFEVHVRTFPEGRRGGQVSVNGGAQPRWSRDGKALYYVKDETLWSVPVETGGDFTAGTPTRLFDHPGLLWGGANAQYDVSANGQFLAKEDVGSGTQSSIRIVQNWYEEFRDRKQD